MATENEIVQYYINQAGSGIGTIYSGPLYQKGYGIGSFLGGLFRACIPFLKNRSAAVGKQLLKSGIEVIGDLQENDSLRNSLRKRKADIFNRVTDAAISGNGYLKRQKLNSNQSAKKIRSIKTPKKKAENKKKKKKTIKDIFDNLK
jgi:hypothetical protein